MIEGDRHGGERSVALAPKSRLSVPRIGASSENGIHPALIGPMRYRLSRSSLHTLPDRASFVDRRAVPDPVPFAELHMSPKKAAQKFSTGTEPQGFSGEERAAMKERAGELKVEARARRDRADGESAVLAKISEMSEPDRSLAERLHAIIKANAPGLMPKTWYGMPAYARDGKVVCFFQGAQKFNTRYATFGFSDEANLDEGAVWPTAFALKELTVAEEARIGALVKKAVR
jgi:uncharacterized protein YdhG (YjbR/CyaY superfamily)